MVEYFYTYLHENNNDKHFRPQNNNKTSWKYEFGSTFG
jgi:hypothetical protein